MSGRCLQQQHGHVSCMDIADNQANFASNKASTERVRKWKARHHANFLEKILYFATGEEKSISANARFVTGAEGQYYKHICRNGRFSLVANDTFHNKDEKFVFCSHSEGGKVRFSSLRCKKELYGINWWAWKSRFSVAMHDQMPATSNTMSQE